MKPRAGKESAQEKMHFEEPSPLNLFKIKNQNPSKLVREMKGTGVEVVLVVAH